MAFLAFLAAAGGITLACVDVAYPDKAFRCNPSGPSPICPDGFFCCSDDPASLTIDDDDKASDASALPAFGDKEADGKSFADPLFAGENNNKSNSGMCVKLNTDPLTLEEGVAAGCPIPCNPKWSYEQIEEVCGVPKAACCQTAELHESDCVADKKGCKRPARGQDVFVSKVTDWAGEAHRTHQDPGGQQCAQMFDKKSSAFRACIYRLSVADQRGFCVAPIDDGSGKKKRAQCPLSRDDYQDACQRINADNPDCS